MKKWIQSLLPVLIIVLVVIFSSSTKKDDSTEEPKSLTEIAADAYVYGRPLLESYENMYSFAIDNTNNQYAPVNELYIIRKPSTPKDTWVVSPNAETPYMRSWIDLTNDAIVLIIPKIQNKRYWVCQLMDVYTNNFCYLGARTTKWEGGKYLLTGPEWKGDIPDGLTQIKSTTNNCALLGRIYCMGTDDIPALNKIQDGFKLMTLSEYNGGTAKATDTEWLKSVDVETNPLEIYTIINEMILKNPPASEEEQDVKAFNALGFGKNFNVNTLSEETKKALTEGISIGKARIQNQLSPESGNSEEYNVWLMPNENVGNFGRLYLSRAVVTVQGYMANSPEEAVYCYAATDIDQNPLTGENKYTIHFDKDQLPDVDFFWSVTMYDNENKLLIENEIDRYSIGNKTDGLEYNNDGSLDIYIQSEKPEDSKNSNWLPAPKKAFYLILRMYGPSQKIINGKYTIPGLSIKE